MKLMSLSEATVNVNGKPFSFGLYHADIDADRDERIHILKTLFENGFYIWGTIWDEPGESREHKCKSMEDIEKLKDECDVFECQKKLSEGRKIAKVFVRADYIGTMPIILAEKEDVETILRMIGAEF